MFNNALKFSIILLILKIDKDSRQYGNHSKWNEHDFSFILANCGEIIINGTIQYRHDGQTDVLNCCSHTESSAYFGFLQNNWNTWPENSSIYRIEESEEDKRD